jgi:glycosyltransferase involved in cell wall biosynthesis
LRQADVLWVNDPTLGVHCLRSGQPVVYDVTDDWRAYDFPSRIVRRIVQAEDILARRARTVVCSAELRDRWRERYGVEAVIVHNGVNSDAWHTATPRVFEGRPPHVGYVGTLQPQRLDIDLMLRIADHEQVGTLHLIGPDALDENSRGRLSGHSKVNLHRPIPADEVPAWTKGLDLLVCPHRITPFTLSLDAIKSYEYLASGRPVLATPTSGFQLMVGHPGVHVVPAHNFTEAIAEALSGPSPAPRIDLDWSARAQEFAGVLLRDQAVAS